MRLCVSVRASACVHDGENVRLLYVHASRLLQSPCLSFVKAPGETTKGVSLTDEPLSLMSSSPQPNRRALCQASLWLRNQAET